MQKKHTISMRLRIFIIKLKEKSRKIQKANLNQNQNNFLFRSQNNFPNQSPSPLLNLWNPTNKNQYVLMLKIKKAKIHKSQFRFQGSYKDKKKLAKIKDQTLKKIKIKVRT
jgi:hypothetical protein